MPTPGGGGKSSAGQPRPKLTLNDAQAFLNSVKDKFQDNKEKYDNFLKVLYDFKAKRLSFISVIVRVKELFLGHKEVLVGFNHFLPKTFKIILPDDEQNQYEDVIRFVNKIKTRFKDEKHKYRSFLEILEKYRKKKKSKFEVYQEIKKLFRGHDDLLVEFGSYTR